MNRTFALVLIAVLLAGPSAALALDCTGVVKGFRVTGGGMVEAKFDGDGDGTYANVCSLINSWNQGSNSVSPPICQQWLSVLTTAYVSGRQAVFYNVGSATCRVNGGTFVPERLGVR